MKSKSAATWLCFFLGCLGVHRFYLGETGMGVLYLLTGGVFVIGAIVDWIRLLTMSQEEFNAKYNSGMRG